MKHMAVKALVALPNNEYVRPTPRKPLSQRLTEAGEFAGWVVIGFAALYLLAHIAVALFA